MNTYSNIVITLQNDHLQDVHQRLIGRGYAARYDPSTESVQIAHATGRSYVYFSAKSEMISDFHVVTVGTQRGFHMNVVKDITDILAGETIPAEPQTKEFARKSLQDYAVNP